MVTAEIGVKTEQCSNTVGRCAVARQNIEFPLNGKGLALVAVQSDMENQDQQTLLKERFINETCTADGNVQLMGDGNKKREHKTTARRKSRMVTSADGILLQFFSVRKS